MDITSILMRLKTYQHNALHNLQNSFKSHLCLNNDLVSYID